MFKLLSAGNEFFHDLVAAIDSSNDYIFIKTFLWRKDESGNMIGGALLRAADRGVKIYIIKDRLGALYEYGQESGQSFFHDDPACDPFFSTHSLSSIYFQARFVSNFYNNSVSPPQSNRLAAALRSHENVSVQDNHKTYDHSKVVIIDGETSYVGGIGFGEEFYKEGPEKWVDYMLKIEDRDAAKDLLCTISMYESEVKNPDITFVTDTRLHDADSSIHKYTLEFMSATKDELIIEMAFLGNPEYIHELTSLILKGVRVKIVMPHVSATHHFRNIHFLKRLYRQVGSKKSYLSVSFYPSMVHSKLILRDGESVFFGSHNWCMDDRVLEETNVEIKDPKLVHQIRERFLNNFYVGEFFDNSIPWRRIFLKSRIEYLSIKFQTFMSKMRWNEIKRARVKGSNLAQSILQLHHS